MQQVLQQFVYQQVLQPYVSSFSASASAASPLASSFKASSFSLTAARLLAGSFKASSSLFKAPGILASASFNATGFFDTSAIFLVTIAGLIVGSGMTAGSAAPGLAPEVELVSAGVGVVTFESSTTEVESFLEPIIDGFDNFGHCLENENDDDNS